MNTEYYIDNLKLKLHDALNEVEFLRKQVNEQSNKKELENQRKIYGLV